MSPVLLGVAGLATLFVLMILRAPVAFAMLIVGWSACLSSTASRGRRGACRHKVGEDNCRQSAVGAEPEPDQRLAERRRDLRDFRGIVPFLLAMIVCLLLIILVPGIALLIPNSMFG